MSAFPGSPRLLKGAIIGLDPFNPLASVIVSVQPRHDDTAVFGEVLSCILFLEVEVDATDQLEQGQATATSMGVYPTLSSLEMLLYPKSAKVTADAALAVLGNIEIIPPG